MSKTFEIIPSGIDYIKRYYKDKKYNYSYQENRNFTVNIVSWDGGWILTKFANEIQKSLKNNGISVKISKDFDNNCDINHYVTPLFEKKCNDHTTFMITHVTHRYYLDDIKELTNKGAIGICMSKDTWSKLISAGISPYRLCYINPAQDSVIKPRKIKLGFFNRIYDDNRKRDNMILDVCKAIDPDVFSFEIMGAGWDAIVEQMEMMKFEVNYYSEFDKEKYNSIVPGLDYFCYFGTDEGAMGYLDAVAAGVKTIVTPQGYHLDTPVPITYPVNTIYEIIKTLNEIAKPFYEAVDFSNLWTWENFTSKHMEIWNYMLSNQSMDELFRNRGWYEDGIYSLMINSVFNMRPLGERIKNKFGND